mgnify:CR=1 FL=1
MKDNLRVSICDGKYTIIQDSSCRSKVLRYGEEWREVTGDNVILGAAFEIEKLKERIKNLENAGSYMAQSFSGRDPSLLTFDQRNAIMQWDKIKKGKS